jgi:hypothetical protein
MFDHAAATKNGGGAMRRVLNEFLLFFCMAMFVTGVVIAAASIIA